MFNKFDEQNDFGLAHEKKKNLFIQNRLNV